MLVHSKLTSLKNCAVLLPNRSIVKVVGAHALKFLQGLITNDMNKIANYGSMYSLMLNSLGRVSFDLFITRCQERSRSEPPYYIVECHSKVKESLCHNLKFYRLQSRVTIEDLGPDFSVVSVIGNAGELFITKNKKNILSQLKTSSFSYHKDPRFPDKMGFRLVLPQDASTQFLSSLPPEIEVVPNEVYHLYRMRWGIAEGPDELPVHTHLPLLINGDYLNGIDFNKGCYIGQELTARTYHVGQVRRRFFGVCMKDPMEDQNSFHSKKEKHEPDLLLPASLLSLNIQSPPTHSLLSFQNSEYAEVETDSKKNADGDFIGGLFNMGIARLNLDGINLEDPSKTYLYDNLNRPMKVITPFWWNSEVEKIRKGGAGLTGLIG